VRHGGKFDETVKRDGYFDLPRVHYYLSIAPEDPPVARHSREPMGRS
jgi:hypothetical protein